MTIIDRTATLCAIAHTRRRLGVDDGTRGPSLSGGWKRLDALASSFSLKQSLFVALLCVGDRSPKTAITGTCSCYSVYFRVNRLYSNCFVSKTSLAAPLTGYLTLF